MMSCVIIVVFPSPAFLTNLIFLGIRKTQKDRKRRFVDYSLQQRLPQYKYTMQLHRKQSAWLLGSFLLGSCGFIQTVHSKRNTLEGRRKKHALRGESINDHKTDGDDKNVLTTPDSEGHYYSGNPSYIQNHGVIHGRREQTIPQYDYVGRQRPQNGYRDNVNWYGRGPGQEYDGYAYGGHLGRVSRTSRSTRSSSGGASSSDSRSEREREEEYYDAIDRYQPTIQNFTNPATAVAESQENLDELPFTSMEDEGREFYQIQGNQIPLLLNEPAKGESLFAAGVIRDGHTGGELHANRGAFEGGPTGHENDTSINNVVRFEDQILDRQFDIPTGGPPSPFEDILAGDDWSMAFLHFEEFGFRDIPNNESDEAPLLPMPLRAEAFPDAAALEDFLEKDIYPLPTEYSNHRNLLNPWKRLIESYLKRNLQSPPMEGRPTGPDWKHQRWEEFRPRKYVQTATTGARVNHGLRYGMQSHQYSDRCEFGPSGLYSNQRLYNVEVRFHPRLPIQNPESLWGFDGTFPPKILLAKYGEPMTFRHYNALPVDVTANRGFGLHTLTTHEHNGHNPAESDGYTTAFFFPGQFYDYRWPMVLAGHDSINTDATDPRAGTPDGNGGITRIPGDWRETMSTHWFHDHMFDYTAANLYKGIAAMMNYYSAIDRGNEGIDDGVNLRFPSGTHLDYGNRDYDINLMIADKAWDREGQLWFNQHDKMGFIGDRMLTNWCYRPNLDVRARRYRFRLLNGSISRFIKIALVSMRPNNNNRYNWSPVPLYMVANDGNIMEHAVLFENGILPTQGIAERYDIVVDFTHFQPGEMLYFVNTMQHKDGQGTDAIIPLDEIMDGSYRNRLQQTEEGYSADPCVGEFMRLTVHAYTGTDLSMDPAEYVEGRRTMIPLRRPTEEQLASATHRTFELERNEDGPSPWGIGTDGGKDALPMDPHRISAVVTKDPDQLEVWRLVNSGSWSHPYHIHFEEAVMISKDGVDPPPHERFARKDVFRVGPDEDSAVVMELAYRFRDFHSTFMGHCHNTQHEDHAMLLRWDVEEPGTLQHLSSPIPTWDGVRFEDSYEIDTVYAGDGRGAMGPQLEPVEEWLENIAYGGFGQNGREDLATVEIGDALDFTEDERGWIEIPLKRGFMVDHNNREIWFVLHDISDKSIAETWGVAFAGALNNITEEALGEPLSYNAYTDEWYFYGDLPNPVGLVEEQSETNNYSSLRRVRLEGKDVVVNAFFVIWGTEEHEHLRIDDNCVFPDHPPNTNCMYNGPNWGMNTGHLLRIRIYYNDIKRSTATFKLHKSFAEDGDYVPYYIVVDSHPQGTANDMGIIWVPKHAHLGTTAVALVQFLPGHVLREGYPPTVEDGFGIMGGGPLGGQIGLPTYFMPGEEYSPAWHIGFAHWNYPTTEVVKSIDRVRWLRDEGHLTIHEFPPVNISTTNVYDFENPNPPHVVNCPTPITVDFVIHQARRFEDDAKDRMGQVRPWK